MFTKLFLQTTDPILSWNSFFSKTIMFAIILSVIFHIILYTLFCNIFSYVFFNKVLTNAVNIRLSLSLFFIMFFGYIGRLWHSKQVYKDLNFNYEKTRNYLQQHYNSWIFIG